jgi:asparagine synthase (glutamine-hydrolysing)
LRSDVPVGAYVSGGIDSSLIAILAAKNTVRMRDYFHGRFIDYPGYDESEFAAAAAASAGGHLHVIDITAQDFIDHMGDVIYHLDFPVAGPGSFPQYVVSELAARHLKVVLGGQGGDEVFGGYARYLLAYFEQCIKAALDGTY